MTLRIFNSLLLAGWALVVIGVACLVGVAAACLVGGALTIGLTLFLALRAGVVSNRNKG